jgi:hypothetical protein
MTTQFYGLGADDVGLFYKARRPRSRWECVAWLDPAGLHVQRGSSQPVTLAWDDERSVPWRPPTSSSAALPAKTGPEAWWVDAATGTQTVPSIRRGTPTDFRAIRGYAQRWRLSTFVVRRDADILDALCQFLHATPDARPGLSDPSRCTKVVRALAEQNLKGAAASYMRPGHLSRAYVVEVATQVVGSQVRLFRGRRIANEPVPDQADLVAAVIARLPSAAAIDWTNSDVIAGYIQQLLRATPWPFDLLLPTRGGRGAS